MKKTTILLCSMMMCAAAMAGCGNGESTKSSQTETQAEVQNVDTGKLMTPAEAFADGDGSETNPYLISTAEELYRFAYVMDSANFETGDEEYSVVFHDKYYELTNDIVMNDVSDFGNWATDAPEYGWEPVKAFTGHFDGNGHSITGLYCAVSEAEALVDAGFFETVSGGTVENLNLEQAMIISPQAGCNAGIVAGNVYEAEIRNCQVSGTVLSSGLGQGGIIGSGAWTFVDNCSFTGYVTSTESGVSGGVIGTAEGCAITNCKNAGVVEVYGGNGDAAGGIAGRLTATSMGYLLEEAGEESKAAAEAAIASVKEAGIGIANSTNSGSVYNSSGAVGGIVGEIGDGLGHEYRGPVFLDSCVNEGSVVSDGGVMTAAAGICGWYATEPAEAGENKTVGSLLAANCTNQGVVTSKSGNAAGVLGYASVNGGSLAFDTCSNSGTVSVEDAAAVVSVGGILGGAAIFEDAALTFENITDKTVYNVKKNHVTGGLAGSVTVAESESGELTFVMKNCQGLGSFTAEDGAIYGALCGSFLEGVYEEDFTGTFEIVSCKCAKEVPAVGTEGSFSDKLDALVEALEAEKE